MVSWTGDGIIAAIENKGVARLTHVGRPGARRRSGPPRGLAASDPAKRVWSLTPEQSAMFQWLFLQLLNERSAARAHSALATGSWLQLLLVKVQRWAERTTPIVNGVPAHASAEVLRLWRLVNEAVSKPNDELGDLYSAPNYDSARHGFRRAFGCSPREMLLRLRMEQAKNLLLESTLSIKEIASRVGCVQPHDFNRLFHRYAGVAPSQWRTDPLARKAKR
jgi:transcriptional regulator GlxA family with amidase domain